MLLALLLSASLSHADDEPTAGSTAYPELGLSVDLRGLAGLEPVDQAGGDVLGVWEGELGEALVRVQLTSRPNDFGLGEPEDVTDLLAPTTIEDLLRARDTGSGKRKRKRKDDERRAAYLWSGPYGFVPYASIKTSRVEITSDRIYETHVLGALLEDRYYSVEVECRPPLDDDAADVVHDFLRNGFRYEGPIRDHEWTDEEVRRRWVAATRPGLHDELEKPIRTEHYIVIGNSSGGALFARKMEESYDTIREVYPFDDVPGRRLMPVFLFTTPSQYHDYLEDYGMPRADAQKTAGVAAGDWYASVYEAPGDPVHIHEATHQIFKNRLRLPGGGSWFQEGVAEYMSTRSSERRAYAKGRAKKGTQVPFRQFFTLSALIRGGGQDETKGSAAHGNYLQAASIIEFARESRFGRDRFDLFVHAVGSVSRGDLEAIEEALMRVYEVDVDGFEREWADYWD